MIRASCPNNPTHDRFITVAHVAEDWVVDQNGGFIEVHGPALETVAEPDAANTWTCHECGAQANVSE